MLSNGTEIGDRESCSMPQITHFLLFLQIRYQDTYYAKVIKVSKSIYKPIYTQHAQEKYYANVSSATVREAEEQQGFIYAANNHENERNTASQVVLHLSTRSFAFAKTTARRSCTVHISVEER